MDEGGRPAQATGWEAAAPRRKLWPAALVALLMVGATALALGRAGEPPDLVVEEDERAPWPERTPAPEPGVERRPQGAAPAPGWADRDHATGIWASLPAAGIAGRADPVVVWTGARSRDGADDRGGERTTTAPGSAASPHQAAYEPFVRGLVLVWGGYADEGRLADGAAYDPTTGLWRRIPPAPHRWTWGSSGTAAWTGDELLVVTVFAGFGDPVVLAYDPDADRWREAAAPPSALAGWNGAAWSGRELVVLSTGGQEAAAYDPDSDRWRALPPPPVESDRGALAVTAIADGLAVFGMHERRPAVSLLAADGAGWSDPVALPDDAATTAPSPATAAAHAAGDRLVLVGGVAGRSNHQQAWAWSPAAGWERLPDLGGGADRRARLATTDEAQLAWLGDGNLPGAVLGPGADAWAPMANPPIGPRAEAGAAWTGQTFVVWGGVGADGFRDDGALFLP